MDGVEKRHNKHSVCIIGAGRVGSTIAFALILKRPLIRNISLVDIDDRVLGELEDLKDEKALLWRKSLNLRNGFDPNAETFIITAGSARKKPEDTHDFEGNYRIVLEYAEKIGKTKPMLIVTNPAERITEELKKLGYNVFHMGEKLDKARKERSGDSEAVANQIIKLKGHTAFGVTTEVLKYFGV